MEFHFITIKSGGSSTILDANQRSRFICFRDRKEAKKYAGYIAEHKARFGTWPEVNLSKPSVKIKTLYGYTPTETEPFLQLLEITHRTKEDLDNMSVLTGIDYFYCHRFDHEDLLSLRLSGQEIDGVVDEDLYRENLDFNIKNT